MVNNNNETCNQTLNNEGSGSNFNWKWLCRYTEKNHEHNRFVWYVLVIIVLLDLYAGLILLDFLLKQLILVVISSQHIFQICVGRLLSSYWLLLYDLNFVILTITNQQNINSFLFVGGTVSSSCCCSSQLKAVMFDASW